MTPFRRGIQYGLHDLVKGTLNVVTFGFLYLAGVHVLGLSSEVAVGGAVVATLSEAWEVRLAHMGEDER